MDLAYLQQTASASQAKAATAELGHETTHGVTTELRTGSLAGLPQHSLVVFKKRKKTSESSADKQKPLLRAFYAEGRGEDDVERRGFYSWAFADEVADKKGLLRPYIGQHEVGSADESTREKEFEVLAQLIVARNPISPDPESGKYVVILNGVSGPGTAALTQVLTGRGNEEAELGQPRKPATAGRTQTHAFNSADKAESILNKLLPKITSKDFYCIYSVISVRVGREEHDESRDAGPDSAAHRRVGAGKTSDWRSILSWELEEGLFEDGEAVQTIHRPRSRPQTASRDR